MSKTKRILFLVFLAITLGSAIWAYFYLKNSKRPKIEAITLLPDSCLVYLRSSDFFELSRQINAQSLMVDQLKAFTEVNRLCATLRVLDSLAASYEPVKSQLLDNTLHMGVYNAGRHWLLAFNIHQLGNQNEISEALRKVLSASEKSPAVYGFEALKGYPLLFTLNQGVVLMSNTSSLLSKALDPKTTRFVASSSYLRFQAGLNEDHPLSVYLNHSLYNNSSANQILHLTDFCNAGYSACDITIEPSELKLNGYLSPDSAEIFSALTNQESQSSAECLNLLPYSTTAFSAYGFDSYPRLKYRLKRRTPSGLNSFWQKINQEALFNVEQEFAENTSQYLVKFKTTLDNQIYVAAQVNDTVRALEHLRLISDSILIVPEGKVFRLKSSEASGEFCLFDPLFTCSTRVACLIGSCLYFGSNVGNLQMVMQEFQHRDLGNDHYSFESYKNEQLSNDFNYLSYYTPSLHSTEMNEFFHFTKHDARNPFENFRHFSFSLMNGEEHFKFRAQVSYETPSQLNDGQMLWAMQLDTLCTAPAYGFTNHLNGEKELVLQDDANQLYLVNAKGNAIWKKQVPEKILSQIYCVDVFKNNKYQILFNTANYLHLIDRNGNYVKGFPVKLPAEATSPMALLDYDNDKDYRVIISCANKTIYNYNALGAPLDGYTPVKTINPVNLPVQYAKVGASDYLVAVDIQGRIYIFSRKGQGRIGLTNRTVVNCKSFYVDAANTIQNTFLVYNDDKSGLINKISFVDEKELIKLNMDTESADVCFGLVDDNRAMDMIITKPVGLCAFNLNGELLFETGTPERLGRGGYYGDESHALFYALNEKQMRLELFNQLKNTNATIEATALPLICDLFNTNKMYLVVPNGNRLCCLSLNQ